MSTVSFLSLSSLPSYHQVKFRFNSQVIPAIKTIPSFKYIPSEEIWCIPSLSVDKLIEKLDMINTLEKKVKFNFERSIGIDESDEATFTESSQFIKRFKTTDTDNFEIMKTTNSIEILLPIPKNVYIQ